MQSEKDNLKRRISRVEQILWWIDPAHRLPCLPVTCRSLAADSTGGVVLAGHFSGEVQLGERVLTSASTEDVLCRLDRAGNVIDVGRVGASKRAHRAIVMPDDHVILTGYFAGALDPGDGPQESTAEWEMFIERFDVDGRHLWSRRFEAASLMHGHGAACDPAGNLLLAGSLKRNPELHADDLATSTAAFLVKVDAQGQVVYSKTLSATAMEFRQGLALDAQGQAAVTGHARERSEEAWTMFITAFDPSGRAMWSRRFGGTNGHFLQRIGMDAAGAVLLTGAFQGMIDFGGGPLTSGPKEAIFLVKLAGPDIGPGEAKAPRDPSTYARITRNPEVMGGKPCIRGLRVTVETIVALTASGHSIPDILRGYPCIEEEDIHEALAYAGRK